MRVLVLGGHAPSLVLFRGPLLSAMVARGHEVITMAAHCDPETRAALGRMGVAFEDVDLERAGINPAADLKTLAMLVRRFRGLTPDVVLGYTVKPVVYGGLAAAVARVPHRFALITGLGYAFLGQEHWKRRMLGRLVRTLYRAGLAGADAVFFQNPDDRRTFEEFGLLPARARVEIVRGSGVDVDHYTPTPVPEGPPVFLFIGRLLREKGVGEFIDAARLVRARHPHARFVVVGGLDPNPASLKREELDRVVQEGIIEYRGELKDVRPAIRECTVLVLPSYREGTPRVVLEAMAMQRAVVTTDAPGCRETIVDGEQGLMVPVKDAAAVARACERLLARELVVAMAERGRARVEELYDARKVSARMLDVMGL